MNTPKPKTDEVLPVLHFSKEKQLTLEEHLALLESRGIKATIAEHMTPYGLQQYLEPEKDSVLAAVLSIPEPLPLELQLLVKAAREGTLALTLEGLGVAPDQYIFSLALLIVMDIDKEQSIGQLWDAYRLWRNTRGVN